jgi:CheY-like chemotaxis protein
MCDGILSIMAVPWNVLVVDDEEDVHRVTRIALRRRTWRGRGIALTNARSGTEARGILESADAPCFHCALVDVVMESNDAGLVLCDFIRSNVPRTTRIVLRTGQPDVAPPERVLNEFDIDYYLAKTEVTEERLFATVRACLRSSQDIAALVAVSAQLHAFTVALQDVRTTRESLAAIMAESLRFLEEKYAAKVVFVHDIDAESKHPEASAEFDRAMIAPAIARAHARKLPSMQLHAAEDLGLSPGMFVVPTTALATADRAEGVGAKLKRWFKNMMTEPETESGTGLGVQFERELDAKMQQEFLQDAELFVGNWRLAENSLRLQDRLARERIETLKNYAQV